jgi:hypothetical protein
MRRETTCVCQRKMAVIGIMNAIMNFSKMLLFVTVDRSNV